MVDQLIQFRKKFIAAKSPEEIHFLYEKVLNIFPQRYKNTMYDWEAKQLDDVVQRRDFLIENCKGKILDLGCSDGMFSIRLAEAGFEVVGVDMLKKRIRIAKNKNQLSNCRFQCDLIENLNYWHEFDTTIISHVLEHSFDPVKIIEIADRATKADGQIIVILPPNLGNDPTHLRFIDSTTIRKILSEIGKVSGKISVGPKSLAYICQK